MIKKLHKCLCCFLAVLLLSGCWDVINIEERGFVIGAAIDLADKANTGENTQLTLTNQFAVPPGLGTPGQEGSGDGKAYLNLSASGESIYAIAQEMANQTSKLPFFEHLKVVIISEEVASRPQLFADVMDVFIRNRDTRRGIKVLIAKGKAKDILNIQPENEKLPARYIDKILQNSLTITGEMKPVRIGDIHEYLLTKNSFILSEVTADHKKIKLEGGAVYKGDSGRLTGRLEREEMLGVDLITGEKVQGPIVVNYKNQLTTYLIEEANSKVKIIAKDPENIDIAVTIELEGEIEETFGTGKFEDPVVIQNAEKEIAAKVRNISNETIQKVQREFEADIFGFGNHLKKFHPDTWEKINKDWEHGENYFAKSHVNVTVKAKVRTDGVVNKSGK
ncbi:Ger(x)C family spore germination protein [Siminovitchia sediminis]|uniref:Ger(X)C family spore germination protein n=1 Tax=Siminovitchia sediminis TaxID=1274353 RepID=A0ABW4KLS5_9BACI